jgi:exodeoxyribonuclease V
VFVAPGGSLDDYDDDSFTSAFDFGYCLTVHKSQGSEWDRAVLIDENHKHERRKWVYTGVTRAAKSIIVQGC